MPRCGVTIGKFYPPHKGHKLLIDSALAQCDELTVIVCDHPNQKIAGEQRRAWLQEIHPEARVLVTPDDLPDAPEPWAKRTLELLGKRPDVVFTSEAYGQEYANQMGAVHTLVDIQRQQVPISATRIRESILDHLDYLEPCVRAFFVKRVVLIGVESTGKTTLAGILANRYQTQWVEEFGREYAAKKVGEWITEDFVTIAQTQQEHEAHEARSANKVLICDTNAVATSVWHRRYMGCFSKEVEAIAAKDKADLYLLTLPDFPFVQDGTRDGEHIREAMHRWFLDHLRAVGCPVVELAGSSSERMERAIQSIESLVSVPYEW